MSSWLIVHFSQGGTTRRVAEAIASGLRASGDEVVLHDLRDGPPPDASAYDVLGVGGPAQYYRPAFAVADYVARLPSLSGKRAFSFALHAAYPGDAGGAVRRALVAKGGRELGYARFPGVGRFLGYLRHGYQFSPDAPGPEALARAERFGAELAARLAAGSHPRDPDDPPTPAVYRLERFLTGRFLVRHLYSRLFRFDREKCGRCSLCMKRCPTGNIREAPDGRRVFGRDCTLCFACEAECPKGAISAPITWALFWPFMVYNTRTAAKDPAIGHVRVSGVGRRRADAKARQAPRVPDDRDPAQRR